MFIKSQYLIPKHLLTLLCILHIMWYSVCLMITSCLFVFLCCTGRDFTPLKTEHLSIYIFKVKKPPLLVASCCYLPSTHPHPKITVCSLSPHCIKLLPFALDISCKQIVLGFIWSNVGILLCCGRLSAIPKRYTNWNSYSYQFLAISFRKMHSHTGRDGQKAAGAEYSWLHTVLVCVSAVFFKMLLWPKVLV